MLTATLNDVSPPGGCPGGRTITLSDGTNSVTSECFCLMDLKYIDTARDELTRIVRGAIDELTMPAIAEVINEIVAQTKEIT